MLHAEFVDFSDALKKLAKVLRPKKAMEDDELQVYWAALRDRPLSDVLRRLEEHPRRSKFFPRPAELRPKEHRPDEDAVAPESQARTDAIHKACAEYNAETWRLLRRSDPVEFATQYRIARASRILATMRRDDPAWAEWDREDHYWAQVRYMPRAKQEQIVAAAGPIV